MATAQAPQVDLAGSGDPFVRNREPGNPAHHANLAAYLSRYSVESAGASSSGYRALT